MKTYKTVTRPAVPAEDGQVCCGRTCDLCGVAAAKSGCWDDAGWARIDDTTVKVTVKHERGWRDSGKIVWDVDICPECFQGKLIPWLISQGAKVREEDIDLV